MRSGRSPQMGSGGETRRRAPMFAVGLALVLALAGCGDDSDMAAPEPMPNNASFCDAEVVDITKEKLLPDFGEAYMGKGQFLETQRPVAVGFWVSGACSDVTAIMDPWGFAKGNQFSLAATGHDTVARLFEQRNFRGHRLSLVKKRTGDFCDFSFFVAPEEPIPDSGCPFPASIVGRVGSLIMVTGAPLLNRQRLIDTRKCDHCNLQEIDFHGLDLRGVSLRGADLSRSAFRGTNLAGAHAERALFNSAQMAGVVLEGAFLSQAVFENDGPIPFDTGFYPPVDLSGRANLRGADLTGAQMVGVNLTDADLTDARLPGADLRKADLTRAKLVGAKMQGAVLTEAIGDGAVLSGAKMGGVNLQGAVLKGAHLDGTDLTAAVLSRTPDGKLEACNLTEVYMPNAVLDSADLTGVSMTHARFYGGKASAANATMINVKFVGAVLSGANFNSASLQGAVFDDAVCVNCSFNAARMELSSTTSRDAATFVRADLRGADFTQATVDGVNLDDALVSFGDGAYSYGDAPEVVYDTSFKASIMGGFTTLSSVTCPDGHRGPCDTMDRLKRPATPTPRPPSPTPAMGCTPDPPRHFCPATPTPTH